VTTMSEMPKEEREAVSPQAVKKRYQKLKE
jgi:hypothetical protein